MRGLNSDQKKKIKEKIILYQTGVRTPLNNRLSLDIIKREKSNS